MIEALINKRDNFEIIRDQIAAILATETASQMALAVTAGEDPNEWKLRVFLERFNPWEQFSIKSVVDVSPIVNVWFSDAKFIQASSNVMERQTTEGLFNIDCYVLGQSKDVGAGGHVSGDQDASLKAGRAVRIIRNILMSDIYVYLGVRGLVSGKWIESITVFQPSAEIETIQNLMGARISLRVGYNEFSPQHDGNPIEYISTEIKRTEDGEIVATSDVQFP